MGNSGNLHLKIASVEELFTTTSEYQSTAQDALYNQYQQGYILSLSNHFRGKTANGLKEYLKAGTLNFISGLLECSSDLTMITQLLAASFSSFETNKSGVVDEPTLEYIKTSLDDLRKVISDSQQSIQSAINSAKPYIDTKSLSFDSLYAQYDTTKQKVETIRTDLVALDAQNNAAVSEVLGRITKLKDLIKNTTEFCYKGGVMVNGSAAALSKQDWYYEESNATLYLMNQENPFAYHAGEVTVSENQWAKGLCEDVYAYAGYKFLTASGETGLDDGQYFAKGSAAVLELNGYAQFTDILRAEGEVDVLYANGEASIGRKGLKVKGEAGVAKADGSIVLGNDKIGAFAKGEAKFCVAEGEAGLYLDRKSGEFVIGAKGEATFASAEAGIGFKVGEFKSKDGDEEESYIFGAQAKAKATAGVEGGIMLKSETAYELEYVNVNAVTLDVDVGAGVGLEFSVTVPHLYIKWPWRK